MENQPKPVNELTYTQAINELDSILRTMQSDSCDIDRLTAYTRRATELLRECRTRLTQLTPTRSPYEKRTIMATEPL